MVEMAKIYLASDFSNQDYPKILKALRDKQHEVFDFRRNDMADKFGSDGGYNDPDWSKFKSPAKVRQFLTTDTKAHQCYQRDRRALEWADVVVGVYPSGISCSLEVAWAAGCGKLAIIYLGDQSREEHADPPQLTRNLATIS